MIYLLKGSVVFQGYMAVYQRGFLDVEICMSIWVCVIFRDNHIPYIGSSTVSHHRDTASPILWRQTSNHILFVKYIRITSHCILDILFIFDYSWAKPPDMFDKSP